MKMLKRTWMLYYDGFRGMTLGRILWAVVIIKLFIIFFILKVFFFPDYIKENAKDNEAEFVARELGVEECTI